ncbi:hypothetical protein QJQ45_023787, partial [Haematococcus lacustris]
GFYDRKKLFWKEVEGATLCAACGPPGGGRQEMSSRFTRHFTQLNMPPPSETAMRTIFSTILGGFMDSFFNAGKGRAAWVVRWPVMCLPGMASCWSRGRSRDQADYVKTRMLKPMVEGAVAIYCRISQELLPTPAKSHYTFNLRDVSKVFQGVLNIRPGQCPDPRNTLMRLWVHENLRVYHDRLISSEDKQYFKLMLMELLKAKFDVRQDFEEFFVKRNIMFGDYLRVGAPREERVYEEVTDQGKLMSILTSYLDEYNMTHTASLNLVFFLDAVQHISRIARILRQPRGSAMLVGVGGSGKQSLTRFAAFMSETQCATIELTRSYGITEFREDVKKLYRTAGVDGKHVAFLFTDNHIVSEAFVEDINNLLNSGEISGLFAQDERERVLADIRQWIVDNGIEETRDAMWRAFINRVRDNLHIVLAMSPVGEAFRARCRQFPSLINCCTIDWFSAWPSDALLSVSQRFLSSQQLGGDAMNAAVSAMCVDIHQGVAAMAEKFYHELRRRFYVTPKSYLDLIHLYISLLRGKRQDMALARDRLLNGLSKLQETNVVVDKMQRELNELQPVLAAKTVDTQRLLIQVEAERRDAAVIQRTVQEEEAEVKVKQVETQLLKDDAQKDLEEVLPALEAAEKALASLNKSDIVEIKTFTKPPPLVGVTMEGVCLLLQEKPDWDTAKRVLGEANFIKRLMEYDRENISDKVVRSLKRLIDDPNFTPDQVAKQSKAAMSLCLWVRAMDTYGKVTKIVEPKRLVLLNAQSALDSMNAALAQKTGQLSEIEAKVEALQAQLESTQSELASLQQQADLSGKRLGRAEKLISALGDESVRWKATAEDLGDRMLLLVGDVFLSAACVSYLGAFTGTYRTALIQSWLSRCRELGIPVSPAFSLQSTLASPVEVREWNLQGLPTDAHSVDNALLVTRGSRWPLMVDPQDQSNRWVKAMESKYGLRSLRVTDPSLLRTLENCIRIGSPVLLEDVGEALDPALEPLLQKQTFTQGTRTLIRLGDSDVDYDPNFRFYMTTKLPNPHYLPEVCIKVNLINFTVTIKGLEDQLLGDVVRKERPELEEAKDRLVVSISNDKRQLQELEDRDCSQRGLLAVGLLVAKVLKLLRESTGNILDDEVLINTLNNSRNTSTTINARVKEAEETERAINAAREVYRPVPVRGSIIFFVIADLSGIDPMYQYSLAYFTQLFNDCIDAAAKSDDLPTRLRNLLTYTTESMFTMVCRGLFAAHKMIFSFLIATAIQRDAGAIPAEQWNFLLRGATTLMPPGTPATELDWLPSSTWSALASLDRAVPAFQGKLLASLQTRPREWQAWAQSPEPDQQDLTAMAQDMGLPTHHPQHPEDAEDEPAPGQVAVPGVRGGLNAFLQLLLIKVLCEDRLGGAIQRYVSASMGPQYTEPQPSGLADIYKDSSPVTPIIFILSQGADPTASLVRFGDSLGRPVGSRLHIISLGQGQGPIAESTLGMAVRAGDWVCLQNCHLAKSWMPRLEQLVEDLAARFTKQQHYASVAGLGQRPESGTSRPGTASSQSAPPQLLAPPPLPAPKRFETVEDIDAPEAPPPEPVYDVHPEFRLWLTSMPAPHFPVPVLQCGVKITQEPPQGLRANLLRAYSDLTPDGLDMPLGHPQHLTWRKLVFAASTFHALLQERRKFGPLGWNTAPEFSSGDFACALQTLHMFLSGATTVVPGQGPGASIPWEALTYVTGQVLSDGYQVHGLRTLLLAPTQGPSFLPRSHKGAAFNRRAGSVWPQRQCCHRLQLAVPLLLVHQESRKLLDTVLSIQPRVATGGSGAAATGAGQAAPKSSEEILLEVVSSISEALPPPLDRAHASVRRCPFALLPSGHDNSLGTVLTQEMDRFNSLRAVLARSCAELQRAVKGLAVMSQELEGMALALINNQVPSVWAQAAYPSLKPLAAWVHDFGERMAAMAAWIADGEPVCFWLPGFFFPQGFMTAALQNHARKTGVPIDRLSFSFDVRGDLSAPEEVIAAPEEGVLVHGLFLECAVWDKFANALGEPRPREMTASLPIIHFKPAERYTPPATHYACPLYKTSVRAGVLSTTGQSTNFVLYIHLPLPAGSPTSKWILQGVAALCDSSGLSEVVPSHVSHPGQIGLPLTLDFCDGGGDMMKMQQRAGRQVSHSQQNQKAQPRLSTRCAASTPRTRPEYIPGRISDPNYVRIFDTTLRDGEQSPGATLTCKEKLDIARQLLKLGVDIIEAGFPIASPDDFEAVRTIAMEVGNDVQPDGYVPVICGLSRTKPQDLERAWNAVRHAKRPRVHTFLATSEIHMKYKLRMSRDQVVENAVAAVRHLRSLGCEDIEFSPEDAGRSDPLFLYQILGEVIKAGATTLNIPDTTGWNLPHEFGGLIAAIKANTPGIDSVIISTHCQNDLGLSTANSLAGAMAGARQIECTINGIGERAGNASLEEVVMAIALRGQDKMSGLYTGIRPVHIYPTSKMVSDYSGMMVQPHKAIVGANAFAHESGIHQDGMLKNRETYEIMTPESIGLQRNPEDAGIVLGKHSGRNALNSRLLSLGYELKQDELDELFKRFKTLADKKKGITDDDILALMSDELHQPEMIWELVDLQVVCGTMGMPTATVSLKGPDGIARIGVGVGTGPVDAAYKAVDSLVRVEAELTDYSMNSVNEGIEALATTRVIIAPAGKLTATSEHATRGTVSRSFSGSGAHEDIVVSSVRAYVSALNKMISWMSKTVKVQPRSQGAALKSVDAKDVAVKDKVLM